MKKAMLVYQAGIANVFEVDALNLSSYGRNTRRLYQGDFRGAQYICHGWRAGRFALLRATRPVTFPTRSGRKTLMSNRLRTNWPSSRIREANVQTICKPLLLSTVPVSRD